VHIDDGWDSQNSVSILCKNDNWSKFKLCGLLCFDYWRNDTSIFLNTTTINFLDGTNFIDTSSYLTDLKEGKNTPSKQADTNNGINPIGTNVNNFINSTPVRRFVSNFGFENFINFS
jgi:dimeric dUTPase (all-alpha-NTP-PPase superfamily)